MTGLELLTALRQRGLSQREFAQKIGYTETTVSLWIRDKATIPPFVPSVLNGIEMAGPPPEAA